MSETKSKIVNESKSQYAPALGYRAAAIAYTKRNYMTKQEAAAVSKRLTALHRSLRQQVPKGVDPMRARPNRKAMRGR